MRLTFFATACWLLLAFFASDPAAAVVIFVRGSDQPVMGNLVREDGSSVLIEQTSPNGRKQTRSILRSDIDDIVYTVSKERLQKLSAESPSGYRDYAEELAEKKQDPEARETALRLYLIAANLDPANLGRSSLLGMINLARGAAEERRFRALAFVIDPTHDASLLKATNDVKAESVSASGDSREKLVAALRYLRQGERLGAANMLREPAVKAELDRYRHYLSVAELQDIGRSTGGLKPEQLRKVLSLELALSGSTEDASASAEVRDQAVPWSTIVLSQGVEPAPNVRLETITEFDPSKTKFDGRSWVKP